MDAYLEMGQTYQDRREVTNAIKIYHKAIEMVEKDPRPYIQASAAYKESRDYKMPNLCCARQPNFPHPTKAYAVSSLLS